MLLICQPPHIQSVWLILKKRETDRVRFESVLRLSRIQRLLKKKQIFEARCMKSPVLKSDIARAYSTKIVIVMHGIACADPGDSEC